MACSLKDEKIDLQEEQLSKKQGRLTHLDSMNECTLTAKATELQTHLNHALENTRQWLEYDQQREAYVRAILARMLWLEKHLNEANQARLQQHNEDHSDEEEQMSQMQEHDEGLLREAKDQQEVLTEDDMINLSMVKYLYQKKERETEELKLQLDAEKMSRERAEEHILCSEYEKQQLEEETKSLKRILDTEKLLSAYFEQKANFCLDFFVRHHHAGQEKTADLERQRDQENGNSCGAAPPPSLSSRGTPTSSPHGSLQNESLLECPSCQARCPASHYRELLSHVDICLDQHLSALPHPNPSE